VLRGFPTDLARLYERQAEDYARKAEKIDNPGHRATLLKATAEWRRMRKNCDNCTGLLEVVRVRKAIACDMPSRYGPLRSK
jgi:hypothetical protein